MENGQCIRADGEKIRNFLNRIKKTADRGWPEGMPGVVAAEQAAERTAQARQRRQRCNDYKGTQTQMSTTKSSGMFGGTSKCTLERFFNPFNQ